MAFLYQAEAYSSDVQVTSTSMHNAQHTAPGAPWELQRHEYFYSQATVFMGNHQAQYPMPPVHPPTSKSRAHGVQPLADPVNANSRTLNFPRSDNIAPLILSSVTSTQEHYRLPNSPTNKEFVSHRVEGGVTRHIRSNSAKSPSFVQTSRKSQQIPNYEPQQQQVRRPIPGLSTIDVPILVEQIPSNHVRVPKVPKINKRNPNYINFQRVDIGGELGIKVNQLLDPSTVLTGDEDLVFEEHGVTGKEITIRLEWPGYTRMERKIKLHAKKWTRHSIAERLTQIWREYANHHFHYPIHSKYAEWKVDFLDPSEITKSGKKKKIMDKHVLTKGDGISEANVFITRLIQWDGQTWQIEFYARPLNSFDDSSSASSVSSSPSPPPSRYELGQSFSSPSPLAYNHDHGMDYNYSHGYVSPCLTSPSPPSYPNGQGQGYGHDYRY